MGAPLPVIGLRGLWALPRDFWLDLSAQYFALEIDEYDGSMVNLRAIVLWQPKQPWLGIGLGYDRFAVDLNVAKDRFRIAGLDVPGPDDLLQRGLLVACND